MNSEDARSAAKGIGRGLDNIANIGMWPNRAVDALAVMAGSKAVYDTAKGNYLKRGENEVEAERMELFDAGVLYNATQQSARPEFLAPVQVSRDVVSRGLSTFMNQNFAQLRKLSEGVDQLTREAQPQIKMLTEENVESGMSDTEARKEAERVVYGSKWKAVRKIVLFGFALQMTWELAEMVFHGLYDDDDGKKKDVLTAMVTAPVSGMYMGGSLTSLAQGYGLSDPLILFSEGQKRWDEVSRVYGNNGFFSPAMAMAVSKIAIRGSGTDFDAFYNMYTAVELGVRNGEVNSNNYLYFLNAPASVRKSYASKIREDEDLLSYAKRVSDAHGRELKSAELKRVILKKVFSDEGDMTRFNRMYELAGEWDRISKAEAGNEAKSKRYEYLAKAGRELGYFHKYIDGRVSRIRDYMKKGVTSGDEKGAVDGMRKDAYGYMDLIDAALKE